jgi:alpha/beta hydrolase family protein
VFRAPPPAVTPPRHSRGPRATQDSGRGGGGQPRAVGRRGDLFRPPSSGRLCAACPPIRRRLAIRSAQTIAKLSASRYSPGEPTRGRCRVPLLDRPGGGSLHYEVTALTAPWRDDPPTIVFHHGVGITADVWLEWLPILADRYRLVRFDMRGFGRSSVPGPGFAWSLELLAEDALAPRSGGGDVPFRWGVARGYARALPSDPPSSGAPEHHRLLGLASRECDQGCSPVARLH